MTPYYLSLGSNIEPEKHIPACLDLLKEKFAVRKISTIYETAPVGPAGTQNFWNLAVKIESDLTPEEITQTLRKIEESLGRRRNPQNRFAPRTIDIDLLPFPDYEKQAFVMIPLAQIEPEGTDRKSQKTFAEIAKDLKPKKGWAKKIRGPRRRT